MTALLFWSGNLVETLHSVSWKLSTELLWKIISEPTRIAVPYSRVYSSMNRPKNFVANKLELFSFGNES